MHAKGAHWTQGSVKGGCSTGKEGGGPLAGFYTVLVCLEQENGA